MCENWKTDTPSLRHFTIWALYMIFVLVFFICSKRFFTPLFFSKYPSKNVCWIYSKTCVFISLFSGRTLLFSSSRIIIIHAVVNAQIKIIHFWWNRIICWVWEKVHTLSVYVHMLMQNASPIGINSQWIKKILKLYPMLHTQKNLG